MQRQLTRRERAALKSWWPHLKLKVHGDNLMAQQRDGGPWGVLLTMEQAKQAAATLIEDQKDKK